MEEPQKIGIINGNKEYEDNKSSVRKWNHNRIFDRRRKRLADISADTGIRRTNVQAIVKCFSMSHIQNGRMRRGRSVTTEG